MAQLYIKGWVKFDYNDNVGYVKNMERSYADSIADEVSCFADTHECGFQWETDEGLGEYHAIIPNCSLRIYFTKQESILDEAIEALIMHSSGIMETSIALEGYSEYSITGYEVENFTIGGHNLESEISEHIGEYMHFVLEV